MARVIPLFTLFLSFFLISCHDDREEAEFQAKVERTRAALGNHCTQDSDCVITGCRNTLCRAVPEPDYCEHRIVLEIDSLDDLTTVKRLIMEQLTVQESQSVQLGGYSAGRWTLSFSADLSQRSKIEATLSAISQSGFARLHDKSQQYAEETEKSLRDPDVTLRSLRGAGKLLEKQIRSGDVLSKNDIHNTWTQLASFLEASDEIQDKNCFWAYDVVVDKISYLRLWPIDKIQRISLQHWENLDVRTDNGDIIITATLDDSASEQFAQWSQENRVIVLILGQEVIASSTPTQRIENGRFELVIHDGASNASLLASIEMFQAIAQMEGSVRIDQDATRKVERDLECHQQNPRTCACIAGSCGWRQSEDYNACLYRLE